MMLLWSEQWIGYYLTDTAYVYTYMSLFLQTTWYKKGIISAPETLQILSTHEL